MTALRRVIAARQLHPTGATVADGAGASTAAELLGSLSLQDSAAKPPHRQQPQQQQQSAVGGAQEACSGGVSAGVPPAPGGVLIDGSSGGGGGDSADADLAVTQGDMQAARGRVRPSGLREVALELPATRWADVGGLNAVKQQLQVPGPSEAFDCVWMCWNVGRCVPGSAAWVPQLLVLLCNSRGKMPH
jgi:hypothetical protein